MNVFVTIEVSYSVRMYNIKVNTFWGYITLFEAGLISLIIVSLSVCFA